MSLLTLFLCVVVIVFVGQFIGIIIQCDNYVEFNRLKGYAIYIPIIVIYGTVSIVILLIKDKRFKEAIGFLVFPDKTFCFLAALSVIVDTKSESNQIIYSRRLNRNIAIKATSLVAGNFA